MNDILEQLLGPVSCCATTAFYSCVPAKRSCYATISGAPSTPLHTHEMTQELRERICRLQRIYVISKVFAPDDSW
jgi:hypothetical protein